MIKFGSLTISNIQNASGLFVGTNLQSGRKSHTVINEGFGTIKGKKNNIKGNAGVMKKRS